MQSQMAAIEEERDRQTCQLRQALNEEREALTGLQGQLGESERNRRVLQQTLQERQDALNQLNQKYENLEMELETSRNVSRNLEKEIESLLGERKGLESKIHEFEGEKQASQERLKKLQQSLEDQISQSSKLSTEQRAKEHEIEGKLQSGHVERERLRGELEGAEERYGQLQEELKEIQEIQEQSLREHRNQLRSLQSTEEKRRGELEEEIGNLKRRLGRDLDCLRGEVEVERKSVSTLKEAIKLYETGTSQAEAEKNRSQQAYKRERDRLIGKVCELQRVQEEAIEREEGLLAELGQRQETHRQLKLRLEEAEDSQNDSKFVSKSIEMKLAGMADQLRELTGERNQLLNEIKEIKFESESIQGQLEEAQDSLMALREQLKCAESIKGVLESELSATRCLCARLTSERDALQSELLSKRKNGPLSDVPSPHLEEVIEQLERDSLDRQLLLRESRRLERELHSALQSLSDRDQSLLQSHDTISRSELKSRKLQTALEDCEGQVSELERIKRRLISEVAEERERADRFQRDLDRFKASQRHGTGPTTSIANDQLLTSSLYSIGRDPSCSSITSKLTETTINE